MIAGLIGTLLLTGLVQVAAGTRSSFVLQEAIAEVQESARFALDSVGGILRQSGFVPEPWVVPVDTVGPAAEAEDGVTAHGDRLALRTWSDRNCFDVVNATQDSYGRPAFFLKVSILEVSASANLVLTCRYGPGENQLVTQIQRQGLIPRVEAFQALYAEDSDGDGRADRWVRAGAWSDPAAVVGLQVALLIASREAPDEGISRTFNVLDHVFLAPPDGRLRRLVVLSHAFRGKVS